MCPSPSQEGLCSTQLGQGGILTSRCECYQWYSILTAHIFGGTFMKTAVQHQVSSTVTLLCEITSNRCKPVKQRIYLQYRKYE